MRPDVAARLALDSALRRARPAGGVGYTGASRWLVELTDGTRAFVKAGSDPMLPREIDVYRSLTAPFLPSMLGSYVGGEGAVLVLEDLSEAAWPPPYPEDSAPLLEAVADVGRPPPPPALPALGASASREWEQVAADPSGFLALGACRAEWLEAALPVLVDSEPRAVLAGDDLLHYDIWGGNICFDAPRALLVDWGAAARGDHRVDLAMVVFALRYEAGRRVDVDFPDEGAYAAKLAVSQGLQAAKPLPDWAPQGSTLRASQAAAVRPALIWAAEKLGLPPP